MVSWAHMSQHPKRHLDRFRLLAQLTHVPNTQTQTTLRATSVATGRIDAMNAMSPNDMNIIAIHFVDNSHCYRLSVKK